jgi:hypothetical protein
MVLSVLLCLPRGLLLRARLGRPAAAKQVTTPILGLRTPEPAGGGTSSGPGSYWANALMRWLRPPRTWVCRPAAQQTAAWAEDTQCHILQCLQWPGKLLG